MGKAGGFITGAGEGLDGIGHAPIYRTAEEEWLGTLPTGLPHNDRVELMRIIRAQVHQCELHGMAAQRQDMRALARIRDTVKRLEERKQQILGRHPGAQNSGDLAIVRELVKQGQ